MSTFKQRVAWATVLGLGLVFCHSVQAQPTCRIITYFADAQKQQSVGTWSNCPGMKGLVGRSTPYREVSIEDLPQPRPPSGTLPCEFQKDCVTSLPKPTVVKGADNPKPSSK